jgi:hypothetical protein
MKMSACMFLLVLCAALSSASCDGDDDKDALDCANVSWQTDLSVELQAITNTSIVYSNDPTEQNCLAFKQAYQNYVDALRPFEECAIDAGERQDFLDALADAQAEIDSLPC